MSSGGLRRCAATVIAALVLGAATAGTASASVITIGSSLTGTFEPTTCNNCTIVQESAVSPVNGVVLRWRVLLASPSSGYRLNILSPFSSGLVSTSTSLGTSPAANPAGSGIEVFPAGNLPIRVGDTIALDTPGLLQFGWKKASGMKYRFAQPPLNAGETRPVGASPNEYELAYNADILPAPATFGIVPAGGSISGGTVVTIAGTDLSQATGVSFGGVPSPLFQVRSDSQVTAAVPPGTTLGAVPVAVTTIAGTAATSTFTYEGCAVPKLRGRKLKAAKKLVRAGDCAVGRLTKRKGARPATGKVVGQNPKPGAILPPDSQVKITLGKPK